MDDDRVEADAVGGEGVESGCNSAGVPVAAEVVCPKCVDRDE
jgi:hypothetical protein